MKSFNGCWTCRLRRKKCDEDRPVCGVCAALGITCHYSQEKPDWMDGGMQQEEMSRQLKREVKENAPYHRRVSHVVKISGEKAPGREDKTINFSNEIASSSSLRGSSAQPNLALDQMSNLRLQGGRDDTQNGETTQWSATLGWSDTILLSFYLEHVFPFLFPFHNPCPLQGGRAWILRLISSSPVVRQAMLCQSSYFLSLSQIAGREDSLWQTVLEQTREAFEVLRQALQVIQVSDVNIHLHGTVRILASIVQVLRFEVAISSFDNCQLHLNAALTLFRELLDTSGVLDPAESFELIMSRLKNASDKIAARYPYIPSAEQTALRFTSSLLVSDDIIASTALQEEPVLYRYHASLLGDIDDAGPVLNLEDVLGCQNWVLLCIGEISVLDAKKQKYKKSGQLDDIDLRQRATTIHESLETRLTQLEISPHTPRKETNSLVSVLSKYSNRDCSSSHNPLITRVWAHAALIYLSVVAHGWNPASNDMRFHVDRIIEILICHIKPPEMLRTMIWPFCVGGCLAEQAQEAIFRNLIHALQPASAFGTARQALSIMETVWKNRFRQDFADHDLAACFRSHRDLVLLI